MFLNKKVKPVLLCMLALCAAGGGAVLYAASPEPAAAVKGSVAISFSYTKQPGFSSNQFAVWIEDSSGLYIKTIYVTNYTAAGGYLKRPESIPLWAERSGIKKGIAAGLDAATGATPSSGKLLYVWDCRDAAGIPVPAGTYRFFVEATTRGADNVLYSGTIAVDGNSSEVKAVPEYSTDKAKKSKMIGEVTAVYTP